MSKLNPKSPHPKKNTGGIQMTTTDRLLMQKVQDQMDETGQLIEKLLVQISDEPDYDRETYIEMKAIGEQLAQLENRIRPLKWKGEPLK